MIRRIALALAILCLCLLAAVAATAEQVPVDAGVPIVLLDGTTATTAGGGGGAGDIEAVGDCATGSCFQSETARHGFMSPAAGGVATFRALVEADVSDLAHTTDTNANTICTGTTTYLDGEGNCDTITADVTAVGDCASGACFDGSSGSTLTFDNAGGDQTLGYDGTDFDFSAALTIAGFMRSGAGSAAAPAWSFSGDPDSGIYWVASNFLALSLGGTVQFTLTDGNMAGNGNNFFGIKTRRTTTATVPSFLPHKVDDSAGVGGAQGGVNLIANSLTGVEVRPTDALAALPQNIGASPPATCSAGTFWVDTDETVDTNCTTTADNSLCLCVAANTWVAFENN